ncbi:MAG: hypothetical protein MJZ81_01260 [Bacteroidales bacterium]|nr:hypothetical protein [Bacteroidales bacterium]
MMEWMKESNRMKHLVGVLAVSAVGTLLMGLGCIGGMEFKDCHHSGDNAKRPLREWDWSAWDWKDVWAGVIGGVLGQVLQLMVVMVIWRMAR